MVLIELCGGAISARWRRRSGCRGWMRSGLQVGFQTASCIAMLWQLAAAAVGMQVALSLSLDGNTSQATAARPSICCDALEPHTAPLVGTEAACHQC